MTQEDAVELGYAMNAALGSYLESMIQTHEDRATAKAELSDPASSSDLKQNASGTSEKIGTPLTQPGSRPVRYRLLSRHGREHGTYSSAARAAEVAKSAWPNEEQDETRSGKGWDIEVVR